MNPDNKQQKQLHVTFIPYMAPGHMMPMIDMARLFASHGVRATIITTPSNAARFQSIIDRDVKLGNHIAFQVVNLPCVEVGIPKGCENLISAPTPEITVKLFRAIDLLQPQIETLLINEINHDNDCIISDMLYPWTVDVAKTLKIPRIAFSGSCFFSDCVSKCIQQNMPHKDIDSETEEFVVPNLPDKVVLTRSQLPDLVKGKTDFSELFERLKQAERNSFGVIMNSFYELEPAYADYFRNDLGFRSWHIGPLSLCNQQVDDKVERGDKVSADSYSCCLIWLDQREAGSVLYVCLGSLTRFTKSQVTEIANALEGSEHSFIWVVPKLLESEKNDIKGGDDEWWLPEGFEERMKSRQGIVIRGWAPQVLILEHPAIGGFLTHCGWNSILEGICAGLPLITWPVFAEQFYNEKIVTQVLKIGVGVGNLQWKVWATEESCLIKKEELKKAIVSIMDGGQQRDEMLQKAKLLSGLARRAVEKGGSSYRDLKALIEDVRMYNQS